MEIDLPEVVAEVRAAFDALRKGAGVERRAGAQCSVPRRPAHHPLWRRLKFSTAHAEIKAFRAARSPVALGRTLSRTVITTYGRDFAVASTLYERPSAPGKTGRQMQTWVKFPEGWRVVAAHVSLIDKRR